MATARLEVEHITRYDYAQPVSMAQHLAILEPAPFERQTLLGFSLDITPSPDLIDRGFDAHNPPDAPPQAWRMRQDGYGNRQCSFSLSSLHDHLQVRACSQVALEARDGQGPEADPDRTPRCAAVAQALRYQGGQVWQPAVEFTQASPYVPRLAALADFARPVLRPDRPVLAAALDLMHRIHRDFRYESRSTEIDTPLTQVLAQRAGVCQDFAHLMIGACRAVGLPARYVSGYLLTQPADGQAGLVGADASHAWVQVWCPLEPGAPEGHWVDLDPTNDLMPDQAHVRVAVGRDFGDVTPLRGVIRGGGQHRLSVAVTTRPLCTVAAHAAPRSA